MAYVVDKGTGEICGQCDAWDLIEVDNLVMDARMMGYCNVTFEITSHGDMIIWAD